MPARKRSSEVVPLIPENILTSLLNLHKRTKRRVGDLNGEMREAVSNAVDRKHLHRAAFNITKRLHAMPDEKLAECHHHLLAYLDLSGINDRVEKVGRLPLDDATNVVKLGEKAEAVAE